MIDGILWLLRTGVPWREIPEWYGSWRTCYERFNRWEEDGTWARLLEEMQVTDDSVGQVELAVSIDSTFAPRPPACRRSQQKGDGGGTIAKKQSQKPVVVLAPGPAL
uniref:transposase n=1 Tax=Nonomuraea pusilla TaxID=46177 RepID=UPI0007C7C841